MWGGSSRDVAWQALRKPLSSAWISYLLEMTMEVLGSSAISGSYSRWREPQQAEAPHSTVSWDTVESLTHEEIAMVGRIPVRTLIAQLKTSVTEGLTARKGQGVKWGVDKHSPTFSAKVKNTSTSHYV
jgi:hypothetical protein